MYLDKAILKNGGTLETAAGKSIIEVSSAGVPSIKADIKEALAQGSIYVGDASGVTSELDASGDTKMLVGNGTTITSVAMSGEVTMTNAGVATVGPMVSGKTFTKTDDGATGAEISLVHVSASPAADDAVGTYMCKGKSDAASDVTYAEFVGVIIDPADGAEFGGAGVLVQNGTGVLVSAVEFGHDGTNRRMTTGFIATESGIGVAGTNCKAEEYGDGHVHTTVLILTDVVLGAPTAGANEAVGALIYTFPAGVHVHEVTYQNVGLTIGTVTTDTPDVGIGSVIGTGNVNVLGGTATFEDYVDGSAAADCAGTPLVVGPVGATAGVLTGISLNKAADVKAVHLNAADGWNAGVTGNLTATGIVTLKWSLVG